MNLNRTSRAALLTLAALAASAPLTGCGGSEADEPSAEMNDTPVGGVNDAPIGGVNDAPVGGVNDDSQSDTPPSAPPEEIPEICPEPAPPPDGLGETFGSPSAETLCDLPASPDAWVWGMGYRGRAVAAEDLGGGRFRFTPDGGEFSHDQYNPDCEGRAPHLVVGGLGTTGLAVGDAVRLQLSEGVPAPEDGDAYASGRVFEDETGALLAAWGGQAGGYTLRDGGPVLNVGAADAVCETRNPGAQCGATAIRKYGATVSAGDDAVTVFGGPTEAALDGATFLVAASVTSITYNHDCDPDVADNSPVNRSGTHFVIVRWVR